MKDSLAMLFFLLSMIFFVLLVIGFFNPEKGLFWSKKPRTKKRSALTNGLLFLLFFILCAIVIPPPGEQAMAQKEAPAGSDKKSDPAPDPAPAAAEPTPYKYELINTSRTGEDIYCKILIDDFYPREALIEKARQLKEDFRPKEKFACSFYYGKYADKTTAVAGVVYLEDCSHCAFKDKDGNRVDFPFYHIEKPSADSLRALRFDTAGYHMEAFYLTQANKTRQIILSSTSKKALLVFQGTDGYYATPLIKKTVDGQDRFYDTDDPSLYHVVNRAEGFVDFYNSRGLDLQSVIEK